MSDAKCRRHFAKASADAGSTSTRQSGGLTARGTGSVSIPHEAFIATRFGLTAV